MSLPGRNLTYESRATRVTNRVLMVLVVSTILIVAFWAVNGGLDEIALTDSEQVTVAE